MGLLAPSAARDATPVRAAFTDVQFRQLGIRPDMTSPSTRRLLTALRKSRVHIALFVEYRRHLVPLTHSGDEINNTSNEPRGDADKIQEIEKHRASSSCKLLSGFVLQ
jgi:hypothetical protein